MVDSDLVSAIQNALERKQHIESIINSLINAGYSKEEVKDAARHAQFNLRQIEIPMSVPSQAELQTSAPTAPLPTTSQPPQPMPATSTIGMYKPLPTIHTLPSLKQPTPLKNKKLFWLLIILNIITLGVVTYLVIKFI